jgi:hypothetical protein
MISTYQYYCSECGEDIEDAFDECAEHPEANVLRNVLSSRTAGRNECDDEDDNATT